jgi:hypothetical protein
MVWALSVHGKGAEIYRWYRTVLRVLADPLQPTALAGALKVGAHQGAPHSPLRAVWELWMPTSFSIAPMLERWLRAQRCSLLDAYELEPPGGIA